MRFLGLVFTAFAALAVSQASALALSAGICTQCNQVQQAPVVYQQPVVMQAPVVYQQPVVQQAPVVYQQPVVQQAVVQQAQVYQPAVQNAVVAQAANVYTTGGVGASFGLQRRGILRNRGFSLGLGIGAAPTVVTPGAAILSPGFAPGLAFAPFGGPFAPAFVNLGLHLNILSRRGIFRGRGPAIRQQQPKKQAAHR